MENDRKNRVEEPFLPENTPVPPQVMDPSKLPDMEGRVRPSPKKSPQAPNVKPAAVPFVNNVSTAEPEY